MDKIVYIYDIYDILLKKLEYCGFRGHINVFLKNYLLDRKVKTQINNTVSSVRNVRFGVPRGSVLVHYFLFFILMTYQIYLITMII